MAFLEAKLVHSMGKLFPVPRIPMENRLEYGLALPDRQEITRTKLRDFAETRQHCGELFMPRNDTFVTADRSGRAKGDVLK